MNHGGVSSDSEDNVARPPRGRNASGRGKAPTTSTSTPSRGRTKVRASKRGRGNTSRTNYGIDAIAGFETVIFKSEEQRDRFGILMDEPFASTRWLSTEAVGELGLLGVMTTLFTGTGFTTLLGMRYLTYRLITLEFLSSFEMNADTPLTLSFRVLNRDYEVSLTDFASHLGLVRFSERIQARDSFDPMMTWNCMSRATITRFGKVRVNDIEHPALRLWFRTLGGTFFGRPEVGTLTRIELCILGRYLNVQQQSPWGLHIPFLVARHIVDVATSKLKTIRIGGIITCLIHKLGIQVPASQEPFDPEIKYIDLEFLRTHHHWYLPGVDRHRWLVGKSPQRWMTLPNARLPPVDPLPARVAGMLEPRISYLIPEDLVYTIDEDMPLVPPGDPINDTSQAGPSYTPPPPSEAPPSTHDYSVDHFHFLRHQFSHFAVNQYLSGLPDYHDNVQRGRIQPPYTSYYRDSTDPSGIFEEAGIDPMSWGPNYGASYGGFGGQFLDQFGRLNVSEHTGTQGQDNDDNGDNDDDGDDGSDDDDYDEVEF